MKRIIKLVGVWRFILHLNCVSVVSEEENIVVLEAAHIKKKKNQSIFILTSALEW